MLTRAAALLYRSRSPVFFCVSLAPLRQSSGDDRLEMPSRCSTSAFSYRSPRAARRPARRGRLTWRRGARAQCLKTALRRKVLRFAIDELRVGSGEVDRSHLRLEDGRLDSERAIHGSRADGRPESKCATMALLTASCGYILYPERKGRSSGSIDTGPSSSTSCGCFRIIPESSASRSLLDGCIYKSSHVGQRAPRDEPSPQGFLHRLKWRSMRVRRQRARATSIGEERLRYGLGRDVRPGRGPESWPADLQRNTGGTALAQVRDLLDRGCGADARACPERLEDDVDIAGPPRADLDDCPSRCSSALVSPWEATELDDSAGNGRRCERGGSAGVGEDLLRPEWVLQVSARRMERSMVQLTLRFSPTSPAPTPAPSSQLTCFSQKKRNRGPRSVLAALVAAAHVAFPAALVTATRSSPVARRVPRRIEAPILSTSICVKRRSWLPQRSRPRRTGDASRWRRC